MKRSNSRGAVSLVEVMIIIAIIAIIAAIAIPPLLEARIKANETAAIATLRNIAAAQTEFQKLVNVASDKEGVGQFGGLTELAGANTGRMQKELSSPLLPASFRALGNDGTVTNAGYRFRIYLPSEDGIGIGEPRGGFTDKAGIDAGLARSYWWAYAWPERYDGTGRHTFFIIGGGDGRISSVNSSGYSGDKAPAANAAFNRLKVGPDDPKEDGNTWKKVD